MTCYYAHSPKGDTPSQSYFDHIYNVRKLANLYAQDLVRYAVKDSQLFLQIVDRASLYHDLGKLNAENQRVLSGETKACSLPVNHVDAGTAYLIQTGEGYAATVIQAHHLGFPDFPVEYVKEENAFRDVSIAEMVNGELPQLLNTHALLLGQNTAAVEGTMEGYDPVSLRLALSCIVDADHTDTALHYRNEPLQDSYVALRPAERLKQLNAYITKKPVGDDPRRTELRNSMYLACKSADISENISSCDSPVGSGKTTAVMAHLLAQAEKRGLRRIFVILPFTNIITQSVNVYREALVLPGENPEEVVAELHHRADFENENIRHLTARWKAPIVVTTAVAFFETLASSSPATLRRLHELPGSAIFVDESHAALPVTLLPLAWKWMNVYADEWNCYWVLASGSLTRFWEIPEINNDQHRFVPEIVEDQLRHNLSDYEAGRIQYRSDLHPKGVAELAQWVSQYPGPRLVILNTVQSAAVLADYFQKNYGGERVEHISTALTSTDRSITLDRVKERLKQKEDSNWTLIATSCVEAGIDLSFHTGFREISSYSSLLQASGRVNREGLFPDSEMWSFCIMEDELFILNPGFETSGHVLKKYLEQNETISPTLCTKAIRDEIRISGASSKKFENLLKADGNLNFKVVETDFQVIDTDTCLAVVDSNLATKICSGKIDWKEMQRVSIQISRKKLIKFGMTEIQPGIYHWTLGYNTFIGYMSGILKLHKIETVDNYVQ